MCGLFGFSGKTPCNKKYMQLGIIWNSLERGEDSTGLYSPINGLKKSLTKGSHYVLHDENDFTVDKLMITHVRAKTVGSATVENAHPFERGNYILAHNGTLTNHKDLAFKYELDETKYNVDSDVICGCIASKNNFDVIKEIAGAAAFLIHDKTKPELLYVFKNSQRPLYRGVDNKGNMYISSLAEPLYFMELYNVKEFKDDVLYTIKDGNIIKSLKIKNVPYAKPYVVPTYTNSYNNYNMGYNQYDLDRYSQSVFENEGTYRNVWLRSKWTLSHSNSEQSYNLIKDTYYLVVGKDTEHRFRVMIDGKEVSIPRASLDSNDLLQRNDILTLVEDVELGRGSYNNKPVGKKGDLFKVSVTYNDSDVGISTIENDTSLGYVDKKYVRKLNEKELAEFRIAKTLGNITNLKWIQDVKNPIQLNLFPDTENANTEPLNSSVDIVTQSNTTQPQSSEHIDEYDYEAEIEEYNNSYTNRNLDKYELQYMEEYFEETDEMLEQVNNIINKSNYVTPELRKLVIELIDLNFVTRYSLVSKGVNA